MISFSVLFQFLDVRERLPASNCNCELRLLRLAFYAETGKHETTMPSVRFIFRFIGTED